MQYIQINIDTPKVTHNSAPKEQPSKLWSSSNHQNPKLGFTSFVAESAVRRCCVAGGRKSCNEHATINLVNSYDYIGLRATVTLRFRSHVYPSSSTNLIYRGTGFVPSQPPICIHVSISDNTGLSGSIATIRVKAAREIIEDRGMSEPWTR